MEHLALNRTVVHAWAEQLQQKHSCRHQYSGVHQVVEGMKFDRGYISPYFVTDAKTMKAELDDPFILIAEKKISSCATLRLPALLMQ